MIVQARLKSDGKLLGVRLVLAMTLLYLAAFALSPGPAIQMPTTLLFMCVCPGLLLYDWVEVDGLATAITLVASASLGVNTLVATVVVGISDYTPLGGLVASSAVSLALATASYSIAWRSRDPNPDWVYQE